MKSLYSLTFVSTGQDLVLDRGEVSFPSEPDKQCSTRMVLVFTAGSEHPVVNCETVVSSINSLFLVAKNFV